MCTFNSKLICSAGVQTFFSQGGAPRQRSEIPHRMIPIPPKVGGSSLGYAYFLHISPLFINTMLLALVINIQFTGKNRPCGAWTMSQLNCPLVYFYSHSLSWPPLNLFSNCSCRSKHILAFFQSWKTNVHTGINARPQLKVSFLFSPLCIVCTAKGPWTCKHSTWDIDVLNWRPAATGYSGCEDLETSQ